MKKKAPAKPASCLSPADHVATVLADKDAAVASLEAERDAARLQAFRLHTAAQIKQAEKALDEARIHAKAMASLRAQLATELAARYAVSWERTAIEPITGQLVDVPKD